MRTGFHPGLNQGSTSEFGMTYRDRRRLRSSGLSGAFKCHA